MSRYGYNPDYYLMDQYKNIIIDLYKKYNFLSAGGSIVDNGLVTGKFIKRGTDHIVYGEMLDRKPIGNLVCYLKCSEHGGCLNYTRSYYENIDNENYNMRQLVFSGLNLPMVWVPINTLYNSIVDFHHF